MDGFCVWRKRKLLDVFVLLTNNGNHTSVPSITSNNGLNKTSYIWDISGVTMSRWF